MNHKPSKPFPNGSTYDFFNNHFCCRCNKYKVDREGMPLPDNCTTENALAEAQFDESKWPSNDIVGIKDINHICLHFTADDESVMESYKALFKGDAE